MKRPPVARWVNTDLPEPLARALASTASQADAAALSRMRAQLQSSIGPAFDTHVPGHSAAAPVVLSKRGKWLAASALMTAGFAFFATRAAFGSTVPTAPSPSASPAPAGAAAPQPSTTGPSPCDTCIAAADNSAPATEYRSVQPLKRTRIPPVPVTQPGLAEELRGVEHIRQELEASPAKGLAAAVAQQRLFAHGVLAPERELLRIEALLRLGRISEARTRAARASRDQPYRAQIQKLLSSAEH